MALEFKILDQSDHLILQHAQKYLNQMDQSVNTLTKRADQFKNIDLSQLKIKYFYSLIKTEDKNLKAA